MGSTEYTPVPAVFEGVRGFAKPAGFRKVRTRFRLVTDHGHALVLHGMDGRGYEPDGDRTSSWFLAVCHAPYVQFYEHIFGGRSSGDPTKFDPNSAYTIDFSPQPRPGQERLGYNTRDPDDVADFVNHIGSWLTSVALPRAKACLADPRMVLDLIDVGPGRRDRVPNTYVRVGHFEVPMTALLAAECGDEQRARDAFNEVVEAAAWNDLWARFVDPLREALSKHQVEV